MRRLIYSIALAFALLLTPMQTFAQLVAYTFTGTLSAAYLSAALAPLDPGPFFIPIPTYVELNNVPFEISIISNPMDIDSPGYVAGGGRLFLNNSSHATWHVDGIGTETTDTAQIYAIAGIGRVGFSWNALRYPYALDQMLPLFLDFNSPYIIGSYNQYNRLSGVGEPISVALTSSFTRDGVSLAPSNTPITIAGTTLWLTGMSNVQYSISEVPVPATMWLFASALAGLNFYRRNPKLA